MIRVHGELWRARSKGDVPVGAKVRVLQVEGLKLDVEPLPAGTSIEK
jgi:membrane protein implicated in regulation of membrane protease activity